ncbi:FERM central domain protein [Opisthorchis viverrini]|uniref:FERM central domain protein n=1 Tax=Opisthorchis viverrini TaxID=6198 RepID=A0A1S8X1D9_OPIVI|nr:FERM central domain protein [Opisthorchis viverrini]
MKAKEGTAAPSKDGVIEIAVTFLDDSVEVFKLQGTSTGHDLFQLVIRKLGLLEFQYFDLAFLDMEENHCWLDHGKGLAKLARNLNTTSLEFVFSVKYYVPHPHLLADDYARYLFAAQIKRDFFRGLLHSNRNTSLLLAAFIVQSEFGDYKETDCKSYAYLRKHHRLRAAPDSYLMRVMELHQSLIGLTKSEADYRLLDAARKVELYGVLLHPVKDATDEDFNLGVTYVGIVVFRNFSRVNGFGWVKIRKLCFKRRKFLIKLHTDEQDIGRDLVEFSFFTQAGCKIFWKKCIEQHAFFRSNTPLPLNMETRRNVGLLGSLRATSFPSLKRLRRSRSCESGAGNGSTHFSLPAHPGTESVSSSTQTSQMSTPLRALPRIRYRSSSLKRQLLDGAEDVHNCLSHSLKHDWLVNNNPYANSCSTGPSRLPGVTRLLSHFNSASDDHFQLLRLSFTSLISQSPGDTGHNTPTLGRLRTRELTRVDRALSTPSIGQTEHGKRKRLPHCLVPRHIDRFVPLTLPRSETPSLNGGRERSSWDEPYPERPPLSKLGASPINIGYTNQQAPSDKNQPSIQENLATKPTGSSSCSLCSSECPTPISLRSNTVLNLSSPWDVVTGAMSSTNHSADEDQSSSCPSLSSAWKPTPLHMCASISSPHLTVRLDSTEQSDFGSSRRISFQSDLVNAPDSTDARVSGFQDVSSRSASLDNLSDRLGAFAAETNGFYDGIKSEDKLVYPVGKETYAEGRDSPEIHAEFLPASPFNVSVEFQSATGVAEVECASILVSSVISDGLRQIGRTFSTQHENDAGQTPLVQTNSQFHSIGDDQKLESDISSSVFQLSSTATGVDAEVPESLADALSLGAISMLTGIFSGDSDVDDDSIAKSAVVSEQYAAASVKSCVSLKQLGRGYWGPSENSSEEDGSSPFGPSSLSKMQLSRARSASDVIRTRRGQAYVNSDAQQVKRSRPTKKRPRRTRGQPTTTQPKDGDSFARTSQYPYGDSLTLQAVKSLLQSEMIYNREMHFLAETTLSMAETAQCTRYISWMNRRVLPLLNPLIDRHSHLESTITTICNRWEQLGNRPKSLKLTELITNSHGGSSIENLDPMHGISVVPDENPVGATISSGSTSSSRISRQGSLGSTDDTKLKSAKGIPVATRTSDLHQSPPMYIGSILAQYSDMIELYNIWLNNCSELLAELWLLGYADFLHTSLGSSLSYTDTQQLKGTEQHITGSVTSVVEPTDQAFIETCSSPSSDGHQNQSSVRELWHGIESHRACTLPLLTYFLRPGRHLRKYCVQLGGLLGQYSPQHPDSVACRAAFTQFVQAARTTYPVYQQTEQLAMMLQMSRWILPMNRFLGIYKTPNEPETCMKPNILKSCESLLGFDELSHVLTQLPQLHQFGWLRKYSRRGFQPRMVFLIGDCLLYASRIHGLPQICLKIHAIIPLHNVIIEKESETQLQSLVPNKVNGSPVVISENCDHVVPSNCADTLFSVTVVYKSRLDSAKAQHERVPPEQLDDIPSVHSKPPIHKHRRKIIFSAPTELIRDSWVDAIQSVTDNFTHVSPQLVFIPTSADLFQGVIRLPDPSSSDILRLQLTLQCGESNRTGSSWSIDWKNTRIAAQGVLWNNLLNVCWRRHLTMSQMQLLNGNDCEMHGSLFRKFQRGSGFQRLWTVLSDFRLTFYKDPGDSQPQTTLTLPGYSISLVSCDTENRSKDAKPGKAMSDSDLVLVRNSKEHVFRAESNQALMSWFQALQTILNCVQPSVPCASDEAVPNLDDLPSGLVIPRRESAELVFSCSPPCRAK